MSYNTHLQNNNTQLDEILETVNSLKTVSKVEQATPSISVDGSGKITATVTQKEGYVEGGTTTATYDGYSGGGTSLFDLTIQGDVIEANSNSLESIKPYAFYNCTSLKTINFPFCKAVLSNAFVNCNKLQSANFPLCVNVASQAFKNCTALQTVDFPTCTKIYSSAFMSCYALSSASFPECSYIDRQAFNDCTSLATLNIEKCITIGSSAFRFCEALESLHLTSCNQISASAFYGCLALSLLTITASSVPTLANTTVFVDTPIWDSYITGSFGSIYVPASLVTAYQSATNWATYSSRITAIPGSEEFITFTIEGNSYSALNGMNWKMWVDSKYNTNGCYIDNDNGYVIVPTSDNGTGRIIGVTSSDVIENSGEYTLLGMGSN